MKTQEQKRLQLCRDNKLDLQQWALVKEVPAESQEPGEAPNYHGDLTWTFGEQAPNSIVKEKFET